MFSAMQPSPPSKRSRRLRSDRGAQPGRPRRYDGGISKAIREEVEGVEGGYPNDNIRIRIPAVPREVPAYSPCPRRRLQVSWYATVRNHRRSTSICPAREQLPAGDSPLRRSRHQTNPQADQHRSIQALLRPPLGHYVPRGYDYTVEYDGGGLR